MITTETSGPEAPAVTRYPFRILLGLLLLISSATAAGALESIYLVRHAEKETPWPDAFTDHQPLNDAGRQRADGWAEHVASLDIAAVYSSPISRTVQTAVPISAALQVPLLTDGATIEADKIGDFVDRLKQQHADDKAVLVVGHSNTIPYFLRHFGAGEDCAGDLTLHRSGNYELIKGYAGLFRIDLASPGCEGLHRQEFPLADSESAEAALPARPVTLDPSQLVASSQRYRIVYGKESMGVAEIQLVADEEQLEVRQVVDIGRAGIRQEATVRLSADGSAHRQVNVQGPMGPSPADIEVVFDEGHARGHSDFPRSRQKPQGKLIVDRPMPAGTFERNALFALLPAMAIDRVSNFSINVYDSREDLLVPVDVEISGPMPAEDHGGREAYRVELSGLEPGFVVWIHPETPRHALAIEWVDQPWVYELIPAKP